MCRRQSSHLVSNGRKQGQLRLRFKRDLHRTETEDGSTTVTQSGLIVSLVDQDSLTLRIRRQLLLLGEWPTTHTVLHRYFR